jgi:metacaspase-1
VLVLAACEQGKYADGEGLPGHFAKVLRRTLNGSFNGPYSTFYEALCSGMPSYQQPDYYRLGTPNPVFESQRPFTI